MKDKENLKKLILTHLKAQALDASLLAELLGASKDEVQELLDEMEVNNEVKYSPNLELYKLPKKKREILPTSKDTVYQLVMEKGIYYEYDMLMFLHASRKEIHQYLEELVSEGKLYYSPREDIYAPLKIAKVSVKPMGYAFAKVDGEEEEYYISLEDLANAFDGDICEIYPNGDNARLKGACVKRVISRAHTFVIGKLCIKGKKYPKYLIESTSTSFPVKVTVKPEDLGQAYIGAIVRAELIYTNGLNIFGKITEVVGSANDPGIEISEIALEYGFKMPFSEETDKEVERIPDNVTEDQYLGRRDFRSHNVITIDGDDSKDFDDAVYLEILPNGNYSLEVHIADVSEYVKEGNSLDKDALERGTSVYLADRVIPMLPYKLSNGICSLNEGVDRLTLSCIMEYDRKGKLVNYEIVEGVIHSHHRMTYKKVNAILNGDQALIEEYKDIYPMLMEMHELSKLLRGLRYKKGGIEFESEEYKFTLNADGSPKEIVKRVQLEAEKLIEDFMLAANETVAYHMMIMNLPGVYRIHEKPDQEKLHAVFAAIASMKVPVKNIKNDIHPKEIQGLLESVREHPNKLIISNMLLRSMMKAKYSGDCLGHYGLAMNYYCHFTSPIRRYPDLMMHRMIKKLYLHPKNLDVDIEKYTEIIPLIADQNSQSERKAIDCERAVNDMLYAWNMEQKLGFCYMATITSITAFGMFASLKDGTEGLIAYRNMDSYFEFNDKTMTASDGRKTYHLGDRIKVKVTYANRMDKKIDFEIEE